MLDKRFIAPIALVLVLRALTSAAAQISAPCPIDCGNSMCIDGKCYLVTISNEISEVDVGGGDGGDAFQQDCPSGYVAAGLRGRSGTYVDGVGLTCAQLNGDGSLVRPTKLYQGGEGGDPFDQTCNRRGSWTVLRGVTGRSGAYMDQIGGRCEAVLNVVNGAEHWPLTIGPWGGPGGDARDVACPSGYAITGFRGRSGSYIDRLALRCSKLTKQELPGGNAVLPDRRIGSLEPQANRQGSDYDNFETGDAEHCRTACEQEDRCKAMTFVSHPDQPSGVCWLKHSVPDRTPNAGMTSAAIRPGR